MNVISLTSFDGYEAPLGPPQEADGPGAGEDFNAILDGIAAMMPPQFPAPAATATTATPKGWNPDIEKLKAELGGSQLTRPDIVPDADPILPPAGGGGGGVINPGGGVILPGSGVINPSGFIIPGSANGIVTGRTVRQLPITPGVDRGPLPITPPVASGAKSGKKDFPLGVDPAILPIERDPVGSIDPPVVMPPVKDAKGTVDPPAILPIERDPNAGDDPPLNPIDPNKDLELSPRITIKPLTGGEKKDFPLGRRPPTIMPPVAETDKTPPIMGPPDRARKGAPRFVALPDAALANRNNDANISTEGLNNRRFDENGVFRTEPAAIEIEFLAEPSPRPLPVTNVDDGIDRVFDPKGVALNPRFDGTRLTGFDLTPRDIDSLVSGLDRINNAFVQRAENASPAVSDGQKSVVAPTFAEIANSIRGTVATEPGAVAPSISNAAQMSRFWMDRAAEKRSDSIAGQKIADGKSTSIPVLGALNVDAKRAEPYVGQTIVAQKDAPTIERVAAAASRVGETAATTERPTPDGDADYSLRAPEPDTVDFAVRLDRLAADQTRGPNATSVIRPETAGLTQVAEQVNPHLLELAALASRKQEKQSLKLRLHPAELGSVEIRLERGDAGQLNAYFRTETDGAREALSQNIEQLRDSLQNAGVQVGRMEIATGADSGRGHRDAQQQPQQRQPSAGRDTIFQAAPDTSDAADKNSPNRLLSVLA